MENHDPLVLVVSRSTDRPVCIPSRPFAIADLHFHIALETSRAD